MAFMTALTRAQTEQAIAPGDTILIKVYQEPDLDAQVNVSKDGSVGLALAGNVALAGKTPHEAARVIEASYRNGYLVKPSVTVTIAASKKERFSVQGQVTRPGPYYFPDDEKVTLLQALGYAGGPSRLANLDKVTISRKGKSMTVNVRKMSKQGGETLYVQPGDVINVPEGW